MNENELDVLRDVSQRLDDVSQPLESADMNDTSPEIAAMVRARLLALSGAECVLMGSRMFDAARAMVLASFPSGLSEIEIKGRLCERLYGDEVDVEAFIKHLQSLPQERQGPHDSSIPDEVTSPS